MRKKKKPWSGSEEERKKKEKMSLVMWQCTSEGAHWDSLFTGLPLSHRSWVLKTVEMCFHFPSSSLIFLSHWITKTESPNMSYGVQTRCLPWAPSILDHEWWKQDHITQNSLHPNMLLVITFFLNFFFFFMYAVQCLWVELRFLYSFTLFFYIYFFLHFYVSNYSYFFFINYGY